MSHYEKYGPSFYDAHWSKNTEPREHDYFDWVVRVLRDLPGEEILDVGCGDGAHLTAFHLGKVDVRRLVGVDFSPVAVSRYQERGGRATVAEAEALPFADGRFPIVLALELLEHVEDPMRCWNEIKRVCSGTAVITVPPMMDIPQHKTVLDARAWGKLLGINKPPDWKGLKQVGWIVGHSA